ncbi:MAG: MoaB/Mog domain-containing protein [Benjaminiella poitrasii]|nr:MAG: MoaB/Mog domain-containing protein [Benjaminiella poitrasii]
MVYIASLNVTNALVSDTASKDNSHDRSGPVLKEILTEAKYAVKEQAIVPDETHDIRKVVEAWADQQLLNVIILTGGTGFSERDVTPEAIKPLLTKETSGITHLILQSSLTITPFAALSRPVTGIRGKSFIITLPGSPKACKENMDAVLKVLPHALDLLLGRSVKKMHNKIQHQQKSDVSAESTTGDLHHHNCIHRHDVEGHPSQTGTSASLNTPISRRARSSPYPLISVEKAHEIIAKHSNLLNTITMPVSQFLTGFVLAEDVQSLEPVPGYRASTVDGYAVHVEDGPGIYAIESISLAQTSDNPEKALSRGKIARVATGGMVPEGANAVIMVEDTALIETTSSGDEELQVEILAKARPGENIREIGFDCPLGQTVAKRGQRIGGSELGLLASVGVRHVKVYRKPRVGILSTGNEVLDHLQTNTLKPGQIRDTNRLTLLAAVQSAGFEAVDLGIVDDKVDVITELLEEAIEKVDVLITTGGVSMGEADFMKPILEQKLGATIHFGRIMMKPGKPNTFATIPYQRSSKLVFALPGNPVSSNVSFYLFVLPALRRMAGWSKPENLLLPVKLGRSVQLDVRPEFQRVHVSLDADGQLVAQSTGKQQSSRMMSMVEANGLLQLPMKTSELTEIVEGTKVPCILIGNLN